jgi:acyl-CoA thioester hydrolase
MRPPFVHRLRIRYSECDQQGHVFNGNYLFLYDVALTELWREAVGPWDELVEAGTDMVVAEARLRFRDGARFDEEVDIELPIARLGTTSITVEPVFRIGDRVCVEGEVRHVCIDARTHAKKEVPKAARRGLEPYVVSPEGVRG